MRFMICAIVFFGVVLDILPTLAFSHRLCGKEGDSYGAT